MVSPMSRATRPVSRLVPEVPLLRRSKQAAAGEEVAVPVHFRCPISLDLMRDPVTAPTGITYDRESVEGWLARGHATCPVTGCPVRLAELVPNHATRRMIQDWCVANCVSGVERVPTPKVPIGDVDAAEAVAAVSAAARRGDVAGCGVAAARARALGKESDRNRRFIQAAGAARVLSAAFGSLAGESVEGASALSGAMREILAALTLFFPLDDESRRCIASPASLKSLVSVMSHGELVARASAAVVLRELASSVDRCTVEAVLRTAGICDALVGLVRNPVSPQATKAALVTAYYLVSGSDLAAARLAELGAVPVVVELLVDADKGTSEKALAVLDGVLCVDAGRAAAHAHALAVPVFVKKMFRVSDMATEFAVSALWRLCRAAEEGAAACRAEALRVGTFQKLLLLLQVGCGGVTKERASELLRMLNGRSRGRIECIETVDFNGLKRPF
ncbi:U-box domain-containing protein 21-like [Phragmites australis]|uniref:U-box domain-containing protein 21-like n=1 Tax=Phragmites australis TaxID=29695 RepID=UPI002D775F18|nr:U-box domain-containing protein 21-like [Phragmites australis]